MTWPWVGRLAYDNAVSDRDHWRTVATKAIDQLTRLERVREGLPETPVERRKPPEPIRGDVQMLIDEMWSADHARKAEEKRARQLYAKLEDWDKVRAVLLETLQTEEEG